MDQQQESSERRPTQPLFPISREAANTALQELSNDPGKAILDGLEAITRQNPVLLEFISIMDASKLFNDKPGLFMEAAVAVYRIIRVQAELIGSKVPVISQAQMASTGKSLKDRIIEKQNVMGIQAKMEPIIQEDLHHLETEDPVFVDTIKEISKYRLSRYSYLNAAIWTRELIKGAFESRDLGRLYANGNSPDVPSQEL